DGTTLNETNWNIEVNNSGGGNSELQYYIKDNISIGKEPVSGENCLVITARKENYGNRTCTSGRLNTSNKMSFKYGKMEARIKLPKTANGLWPAFWMLGADYSSVGWPRSGEIDIMEMGNSDGIKNGTQEFFFNGACHWGYYQPAGWYPNYPKATTNSYSLQDDFHLFTIIWDSQYIRMYLDLDKYPDAKPYYEMGITAKASDIDPYYYFNKPFFVILNLAVGGNFTQIWDINSITALAQGEAKMYVDYVKVYQKGDSGEEYSGPTLSSINEQNVITNQFYIYPNPATHYIHIDGGDTPSRIDFFNLSGQEIMVSTNTNVVDISALLAGNYILKIQRRDGTSEVHHLIKR
ncbi:MAG: family 16 glycosylhydrolase, partial [Dysgonomonas sp.]